MLERLEIENYALIEHLEIDFSSGFNVISGETGSGKSIILGALALLLGEKADTDSIRSGADELTVNGVFSLEKPSARALKLFDELGIDISTGDLAVRRVVKASGRSIVRIQGESMSLRDLAAIGAVLVDVHGQSEHQSLLSRERQRDVVDACSENPETAEAWRRVYSAWKAAEQKFRDLEKTCSEAQEKAGYLEYAVKEIEAVSPKAGEEDELKAEILRLSSFEKIAESVSFIKDSLASAVPLLSDSAASAQKASAFDPALSEFSARLESLRIECGDIRESLTEKYSFSDFSEERLDRLQSRQNEIGKLKRKYGGSIDSVLAFLEDAKRLLSLADDGRECLRIASDGLQSAAAEMKKCGSELSALRTETGKRLAASVAAQLRELGMSEVRFEIAVEPADFSESGADSVEMLIGANPGEPMRPVRHVASGGELSRIMLAIKSVLSGADDIPTQVFDEVDAGIGGSVALSVGQCLCELSDSRQVIAVTHLASVAALAQTHIVVSKYVKDGRTYTCVRNTEGEERVAEVARMLSGDSCSSVSLEHARSLLRESECRSGASGARDFRGRN